MSLTVGENNSEASEISSSCLSCSLKWSTNCSVVPLKLSSRTVLVTYWVSHFFSEATFKELVMCSCESFQTACQSVLCTWFLTIVLPMSVHKCVLNTENMKTCSFSNNSVFSGLAM